jgi:hypothetical protein
LIATPYGTKEGSTFHQSAGNSPELQAFRTFQATVGLMSVRAIALNKKGGLKRGW